MVYTITGIKTLTNDNDTLIIKHGRGSACVNYKQTSDRDSDRDRDRDRDRGRDEKSSRVERR